VCVCEGGQLLWMGSYAVFLNRVNQVGRIAVIL
jgi:hypothetical protein